MSEDYYDYAPQLKLHRHLVVAGYIGSESRAIGHRLAAFTGLPFADLDRKIEHYAGRSVWDLLWQEGETRYRTLEREILTRELAARPLGVLVLGDGTLIDPRLRQQVLREATLLHLDLDLANCYWRLKANLADDAEHWHPLYPGPLDSLEQLQPFYDRRQQSFEKADHRIELRGKHPTVAAEEIHQWLLEELDQGSED